MKMTKERVIILGLIAILCYSNLFNLIDHYSQSRKEYNVVAATSPDLCRIVNFIKQTGAGVPQDNTTLVSLVTHGSVKYLDLLLKQSERWDGPISATIYLTESEVPRMPLLSYILSRILFCHPYFKQKVSIHLLFRNTMEDCSKWMQYTEQKIANKTFADWPQLEECPTDWPLKETELQENILRFSYPINTARNLAVAHAPTELILIVDMEFVPSSNFNTKFRPFYENWTPVQEKEVFVIPALEVRSGITPPKSIAELGFRRERKEVVMFKEFYYKLGHYIPKEAKWWEYSESVIGLHITTPYIQWRWEPIFVGKRSTLPTYSELFRGYGSNKITHVFEMCCEGFVFHILNGAFLVHGEGLKSSLPKSKAKQTMIEANAIIRETSFMERMLQRYGANRVNACKNKKYAERIR